jgi:type VI secretion system protein ImpJ
MDSIKSLHWKQGLFLKPQHFQQLDLYNAAMSNLYSSVRSGLSAGIAQLTFDTQALQVGLLRIDKLQCILEDGTLVAFPGNCQIAPLTLDHQYIDVQGKIEVFVGLAPIAIDKTNVVSESNANARFLQANEINKKDLFDSNEQAILDRLELNCQVLTRSQIQNADGLNLVKIAELQFSGEEYQLSKSYVPKVTLLSGTEALSNMVKATKQQLIERYKQLQSISSFELGLVSSSNSLPVGLAMMSISNHVSTFSQLEEDLTTSPSDVYLAYRQLISQLSMFSSDVSVTGETIQEELSVVAYSQNNLTECFSRINKLTTKLLNTLTIEPELLVTLEHQGASKFVASLPNKFLESNTRVYLRIRSNEDISQQLDSVLNYLKIGADGQVDVYLKRALPGIELSYLSKKPQGVATVPNSYYFDLDRQSFQWQKVVDLKRIALIWSDFPEDVNIELLAVQG